MSSAIPMTSRVRDVLLYTSAPTGRMDRTVFLASSPDSTTVQLMPLPSRAPATAWISSRGAGRENSASASRLGPSTDGFPDPLVHEEATSLTAYFGQPLVHQGNHHRSLPYCGRATLDRFAANVAGGEQPGKVRFER